MDRPFGIFIYGMNADWKGTTSLISSFYTFLTSFGKLELQTIRLAFCYMI